MTNLTYFNLQLMVDGVGMEHGHPVLQAVVEEPRQGPELVLTLLLLTGELIVEVVERTLNTAIPTHVQVCWWYKRTIQLQNDVHM